MSNPNIDHLNSRLIQKIMEHTCVPIFPVLNLPLDLNISSFERNLLSITFSVSCLQQAGGLRHETQESECDFHGTSNCPRIRIIHIWIKGEVPVVFYRHCPLHRLPAPAKTAHSSNQPHSKYYLWGTSHRSRAGHMTAHAAFSLTKHTCSVDAVDP